MDGRKDAITQQKEDFLRMTKIHQMKKESSLTTASNPMEELQMERKYGTITREGTIMGINTTHIFANTQAGKTTIQGTQTCE